MAVQAATTEHDCNAPCGVGSKENEITFLVRFAVFHGALAGAFVFIGLYMVCTTIHAPWWLYPSLIGIVIGGNENLKMWRQSLDGEIPDYP